MSYLHVEILHRGYLVLTAVFCKRLHHLKRIVTTDQSVRLNMIRDGNR